MGDILSHRPVLLIAAVFSRHASAIDWAKHTASAAWGPMALESDRFEHNETRYYEASMGAGLLKTFFAFEQLVDPARLVELKLQSNAWEEEFKATSDHADERPLNIDPGYLTEAKLVLASTKDRDHRLYLDRGIYAENTLYYTRSAWQSRPWTYPDYLRSDYHEFFRKCRDFLRAKYRASS